MKKKRWKPICDIGWKKIFFMARITLFFLLTGLLQVSASVYSQQTNLHLKVENASVSEVLKLIEEQSDFHFLYRSDLLKKVPDVTIDVEEAKLEEVMNKLFVPYGFTYEIDDRTVVIKKSAEVQTPKVAEQQQQKKVTGFVRDDAGAGLPAVSIGIKGTSKGTLSNEFGEFTLDAKIGDVIVFSFIGKIRVEKIVGQRNVIDVVLLNDQTEIEEVQVVAFGTQKKSSVIASITTIKPAELKQPASNLTSALAGKIPGIISYQSSGEPGKDNAQFFVRGVTTFGYKTSPLILIDGFEATSNDLARMEPDNIESFSILKDASATVLYGARGANGIIMVATKSGREGPAKMNIRLDTHIATPT